MVFAKYLVFTLCLIRFISSEQQIGPDPWDYETQKTPNDEDVDIPPDLKVQNKRTISLDLTLGDIFFRRLIAIIMKGSQTQRHEDGSVEVLLQMRFDPERWSTLDKYMKSNTAITESVLRLSMGYIEEAIYKPTIIEKVIMAWSDYVQGYLTEYKMHIMWTFGALATLLTLNWLRRRMSHKHVLLIIFITLYFYEVFISYKEAEQLELERFISALNKCRWQFWASSCEAPPPPDLIAFMKHMNPLKIAIRMFTTIISEPMISLSATIKIMISSITDGLWFPFDKIVYGILTLSLNALLIVLLVLIVFNYILNIPFSLSFPLFSIAVRQRNRTLFSENDDQNSNRHHSEENTDRISGATLNRLLDVFSHAISKVQTPVHNMNREPINTHTSTSLRRSASTGRLPSLTFDGSNVLKIDNSTRKRKNVAFHRGPRDGGGDAQ